MAITQEIINIGTTANDATGDTLRTAFTKINNNFAELYSTAYYNTEVISVGNNSNGDQIIFETPANTFTEGSFQINSSEINTVTTANSQNIVMNIAMNNYTNAVQYNGFGTIFIPAKPTLNLTANNVAICTYSSNVADGYVRIYANHVTSNTTVTTTIKHLISYRISYYQSTITSLGILTEDSYGLTTENDLLLITET